MCEGPGHTFSVGAFLTFTNTLFTVYLYRAVLTLTHSLCINKIIKFLKLYFDTPLLDKAKRCFKEVPVLGTQKQGIVPSAVAALHKYYMKMCVCCICWCKYLHMQSVGHECTVLYAYTCTHIHGQLKSCVLFVWDMNMCRLLKHMIWIQ